MSYKEFRKIAGTWEWLKAERTYWRLFLRNLSLAIATKQFNGWPCSHCLAEHRSLYFRGLAELL